jgi:N-acetylmuramoyl-L-alanine amidase
MLSAPLIPAAPPPLDGKVIILDPGHGAGNSPGFAGYQEHAAMLRLALKIKPLLESQGATVYLTRSSSRDVPLAARAAMVNIWALEGVRDARAREPGESAAEDIAEINRLLGIMQSIVDNPSRNGGVYMNTPFSPDRSIHPDMRKIFELQDDPEIAGRFLVISLHSNGTGRPIRTWVNGADVFHISNTLSGTKDYYSEYSHWEHSRRFGNILLNHIHETGIRRRSVTSENFLMIREHNVPGVLAENGYHTNARDRANLQNDRFLDRLALAYLGAITQYFDSERSF